MAIGDSVCALTEQKKDSNRLTITLGEVEGVKLSTQKLGKLRYGKAMEN